MDNNESLNKAKYKVENQERSVKEEKTSAKRRGEGISQIWEGEKNLVG